MYCQLLHQPSDPSSSGKPSTSLTPYTIICQPFCDPGPHLIWRPSLTSTLPSSHPLTILVRCVIDSSTIHLIHLIKSQQSKFLGTPPVTSMVTLPLLTQSFACPYPESTCSLKASVFLCDHQPSSPQTVSANPPESTSPSASSTTARSTSSHSQVPELQFLG